jgi:hypothetical protein
MAIVSTRRLADVLIGLLLCFSVRLRVCALESELEDVIQQTGSLKPEFELSKTEAFKTDFFAPFSAKFNATVKL